MFIIVEAQRRILHEIRMMFLHIWYYLLTRICKELCIKTAQGIYYIYTKDRVVGKSLFLWGEWEQSFKDAFHIFLAKKYPRFADAKDVTLYNIGANIGTTCISAVFLEKVSNAIAVEAEHANYRLLKKNVARNKLTDRVHCVHCAVADKKGTVTLRLNDRNLGDHRVAKRISNPPRANSMSIAYLR